MPCKLHCHVVLQHSDAASGTGINVVQLWQLQCADQGHEEMNHSFSSPGTPSGSYVIEFIFIEIPDIGKIRNKNWNLELAWIHPVTREVIQCIFMILILKVKCIDQIFHFSFSEIIDLMNVKIILTPRSTLHHSAKSYKGSIWRRFEFQRHPSRSRIYSKIVEFYDLDNVRNNNKHIITSTSKD